MTDSLIKSGRLAGSLSGGHSDRAVYLPDIYAKCQNQWVDSFYLQNGYLGNFMILHYLYINFYYIFLNMDLIYFK